MISYWLLIIICLITFVACLPTRVLRTFPAATNISREGQKQGSHFVENLSKIIVEGFDVTDSSDLGSMIACTNGLVTCDENEECDCSLKCGGSTEHEPFPVETGRKIVVGNRTLEEGKTYCLPVVRRDCNRRTTKMVYTAAGWQCINTIPHLYDNYTQVACVHKDETTEVTVNRLFDFLKNKPINISKDLEIPLNEIDIETGFPRVRCKCESNNRFGNKTVNMPSVYPYSCVDDPCKEIVSNAAFPGFVGVRKGCDCGSLLKRIDPKDPYSPCTPCFSNSVNVRYEDNEKKPVLGERFTLSEPCYGAYSLLSHAISGLNPCSLRFFAQNSKNCLGYTLPDYIKGFPKDFST